MISRDQILQPIFPYEGTRKTPAPVVDSLNEGISPGSLYQTYAYFLVDRVTGLVYDVHIPPLEIGPGGIIVYQTAEIATLTLTTTTDPTYQGIRINNGWDVYVRSGVLATEQRANALGIVDGICDFGAVPTDVCSIFMRDATTGLIYEVDFSVSPPTSTASSGSPVFDAVQVNDGWYIVLNGSLTSSQSLPSGTVFSNPCILDHVRIASNGTNEGVGGNGGGGVNPTPEPATLALQVTEPWLWLLYDATLQVDDGFELTLPSIGSIQVNEGFES